MDLQLYLNEMDRFREEIFSVSDGIWDLAELPFHEFGSAELLTEHLEKHGFSVSRGVAGMPTAFTASCGTEGPVIGILAEYDALAGLSQEAEAVEPKPRPGALNGHGCGHNLFAGGSFGAALAVKKSIEETGKGTVVLFGCPAEEGGAGKVFMVRAGLFSGVDAVVSWHPEKIYMVRTRPSLANAQYNYSFTGISSHAGGSPHLGRSALDALELMNIGINFLREHMETTCRINTSIVNAGGAAPNIIPSYAEGCFLIRAEDRNKLRELCERVDRVAQGAALMTDTKMSKRFISAYSNLITIPALQQAVYEVMRQIPVPVPTPEDVAFGKALQQTMRLTAEEKTRPVFASQVLPPAPPRPHGGSTDTADVSWVCPTVQIHGATWAVGTPGHSWQSVSQARGHHAKEAMLYTGKAVALTAMRLIHEPSLLEAAKREHRERVGEGYECPIPPEIKPGI